MPHDTRIALFLMGELIAAIRANDIMQLLINNTTNNHQEFTSKIGQANIVHEKVQFHDLPSISYRP